MEAVPEVQSHDEFMADVREMRRILTQIRRITTINVKQGADYFEAATVGEVAKAAKVTPEHVVATVEKFDAWRLAVDRRDEMPIAEWWVYQDGE